MNLEEFKARASAQEDWAPGWEAIDAALERLYPGQEPAHYATLMTARAMFGGEEYLDGYSAYTSPNGYQHLLTYGMSELYTNEEAFGGEWSGWGYEMTMKLPEQSAQACQWAFSMLGNLARYTFTQKRYFEPLQYVSGGGQSICCDRPDSAITGLLVVEDTELPGIDTLYGRVDFLQLVGITEPELQAVIANRELVPVLLERMKQKNPRLITDLNRKESYL
ncbi:MAG: suppressor of fused domain protein [Anaerotruncus sp.]|nr:suppressor of fused domain protein [Anaerotruncus sp.]